MTQSVQQLQSKNNRAAGTILFRKRTEVLKISQPELALRTGLEQSQICRIENGCVHVCHLLRGGQKFAWN